uniref:uncharacterized protein LOC120335622 n=1 Tax=Styela clava TaxID=7725 RepID=UPI001939697D|nr:uncharacterized protein LOC120335622 [Styela clava]XP_039259093.1 uncharacterized protein LOC120335622 [Styela clava]
MLRLALLATFCCLASTALTDSGCTNLGGACQDWRYYKCTAGYETGLCSGDSNRRCCLPCDLSCRTTDSNYDDSACENIDGTCMDNSNYCTGGYSSGYCGGPSDRQCCSANSGGGGIIGGGGSCDLVTYSSLNIKGYNNLKVEVHSGFVADMDTLNSYARQCDVTVWVTHAFREEGQNLGGTVVPPATTSNHLVGHAIDFNLDTPNGWCNGDCLYDGYNSNAQCFIQKVLDTSGLRWGGYWSPSDPVHIDDGLNAYHYNEWEALYYDLQGKC